MKLQAFCRLILPYCQAIALVLTMTGCSTDATVTGLSAGGGDGTGSKDGGQIDGSVPDGGSSDVSGVDIVPAGCSKDSDCSILSGTCGQGQCVGGQCQVVAFPVDGAPCVVGAGKCAGICL